MNFILASIGVFLVTILVLVVILLVAKNFLVASGNVKLTINGDKEMEVESGSTLLNTLAVNGQCVQQRRAGFYFHFLVAVDSQFHVAGSHKEILRYQQDDYQHQNSHQEYSNAR